MSSFQGIWVPVVTPFHNGVIDFIGLRRLVCHLLEQGAAGIMVCTTTGEAAALSRREQLAMLDAVLELVPPQAQRVEYLHILATQHIHIPAGQQRQDTVS